MWHPELFDPLARGLFGHRRGFDRRGATHLRPLYRTFQPLQPDRLQHIVNRVAVERLDREIIMRGHEHHCRAVSLPGQRPRHAQPIDLGHRHVQQDKIGRKCLDQAQCRRAVAGRSHHLQRRNARTQDLHALDCERLIVDNQRAHSVPLNSHS